MGDNNRMIYLTSTNQQAIIDAQAKITANCNFPKNGTVKWANVQKAVNQDLWFIEKPMGYRDIAANAMMTGVNMTGIIEMEKDAAWFPPDPETVYASQFTIKPAGVTL